MATEDVPSDNPPSELIAERLSPDQLITAAGRPTPFEERMRFLKKLDEDERPLDEAPPIDLEKLMRECFEALKKFEIIQLDDFDPKNERHVQLLRSTLTRLRFPKEISEAVIRRSDFRTKIMPLLLIFQRIISRTPGVLEKLKRAEAHMTDEKPFVGTEFLEKATVIRVDIEGSSRTRQALGQTKAMETFNEHFLKVVEETLRRFPEVRMVETAGDEIVFVARKENHQKALEFTQVLNRKLVTNAEISVHIGVAIGNAEISILSNGLFLIGGEAYTQAETAQKEKVGDATIGKIGTLWSRENMFKPILTNTTIEEPPVPPHSAIRFERLCQEEMPTDLPKRLREILALITSTMGDGTLEIEDLKFPKIAVGYIHLIPPLLKEDVNPSAEERHQQLEEWLRPVYAMAVRYGVTLNYSSSDGKLVVFTGAFNNPLDQLERMIGFAQTLQGEARTLAMGFSEGQILIGAMGGTVTGGSSEIDLAARIAGVTKLQANQYPFGFKAAMAETLQRRGFNLVGAQTQMVEVKNMGQVEITFCEKIERVPQAKALSGYEGVLASHQNLLDGAQRGLNLIHCDTLPGNDYHGFIEAAAGQARERSFRVVEGNDIEHYGKPFHFLGSILNQFFKEIEFNQWLNSYWVGVEKRKLWKTVFEEFISRKATTGTLQSVTIIEETLIEMLETVSEARPVWIGVEQMQRVDELSAKALSHWVTHRHQRKGTVMIVLDDVKRLQEVTAHSKLELHGIDEASAYARLQQKMKLEGNVSIDESVAQFFKKRLGDPPWPSLLIDHLIDDSLNMFAKNQGRGTGLVIGLKEQKSEKITNGVSKGPNYTEKEYAQAVCGKLIEGPQKPVFIAACLLGTPGDITQLREFCRDIFKLPFLRFDTLLKNSTPVVVPNFETGTYRIQPAFIAEVGLELVPPNEKEAYTKHMLNKMLASESFAYNQSTRILRCADQGGISEEVAVYTLERVQVLVREKRWLEAEAIASQFMNENLGSIKIGDVKRGVPDKLKAALQVGIELIEILITLHKDNEVAAIQEKTDGYLAKLSSRTVPLEDPSRWHYHFAICRRFYMEQNLEGLTSKVREIDKLSKEAYLKSAHQVEVESELQFYNAARIYRKSNTVKKHDEKEKLLRKSLEKLQEIRCERLSESLQNDIERMKLIVRFSLAENEGETQTLLDDFQEFLKKKGDQLAERDKEGIAKGGHRLACRLGQFDVALAALETEIETAVSSGHHHRAWSLRAECVSILGEKEKNELKKQEQRTPNTFEAVFKLTDDTIRGLLPYQNFLTDTERFTLIGTVAEHYFVQVQFGCTSDEKARAKSRAKLMIGIIHSLARRKAEILVLKLEFERIFGESV